MMNALRRRSILLWCEGKGSPIHLAGETKTLIHTYILLAVQTLPVM